jgi:hypothetical protein
VSAETNLKLNLGIRKNNLTLKEILADQWLRLNLLYWIQDKDGNKIRFSPWQEQKELYWDMHYLNIILKARQRGMSTFVDILMLDFALFNTNVTCGLIAQTIDDGKIMFRDNILFAYDNLPDDLKRSIPAVVRRSDYIEFGNGSKIIVDDSLRGRACQFVHISEFGKICAKYPNVAQEIVTGALQTVKDGNFIFIESTGEGAHGAFYDMCQDALQMQRDKTPLTAQEYKIFFFAWFLAVEYENPTPIETTTEMDSYFNEIEDYWDITISPEKRYWYVRKQRSLGKILMKQEYPSTPEEAFRGITKGAVFGDELFEMREQGRICSVPYHKGAPVNTFWDLGRNMMSIWFHQRVGTQNRFIAFYQREGINLQEAARVLLQDIDLPYHKYTYGIHYLPHDAENKDLSQGENKTRERVLNELGIKPTRIVPRIKHLDDGIEMTRQMLSTAVIDETLCETGIKCLENYYYKYDDKLETFVKVPVKNWAEHACDAIRQHAQGYREGRYIPSVEPNGDHQLSRKTRLKKHRGTTQKWRV